MFRSRFPSKMGVFHSEGFENMITEVCAELLASDTFNKYTREIKTNPVVELSPWLYYEWLREELLVTKIKENPALARLANPSSPGLQSHMSNQTYDPEASEALSWSSDFYIQNFLLFH